MLVPYNLCALQYVRGAAVTDDKQPDGNSV